MKRNKNTNLATNSRLVTDTQVSSCKAPRHVKTRVLTVGASTMTMHYIECSKSWICILGTKFTNLEWVLGQSQ